MGLACVILAAGKGTRMNDPDRAKVMFPVGGVPMIDHVVDRARESGADHVAVVIGHQREAVRNHLAERYGDFVAFAEQIEQRGTGHAVMQTIPMLAGRGGETLVLSGDVPLLTTRTIAELVAHHRSMNAAATVLTVEAPDPTGYGRVLRKPDGSVARIVEHRDATDQERDVREINSGIYVFNTVDLLQALSHLRPDNAQGEYYLTDVFAWLRSQHRPVFAWRAGDYDEVHGINTREQLAAADIQWARTRGMRISHIGVAVADLEEAMRKYGALFGNLHPHRERVDEQMVDVASFPVGDAVVELTAATDDASPIAKFLARRGEGVHHIAIEVKDLQSEIDRLKGAGVRLIDESPRQGAHDMLIAFVHPSSFNGVLVELCQKRSSAA